RHPRSGAARSGHEPRGDRQSGDIPLSLRAVGALPVRRAGRLPATGPGPRAAARGLDAALLRAHGRVHQRHARADDRAGRTRDRGPGRRVRAAQAVPRDPLARVGGLMPPRRRSPYRILLPLANPRTARDLVRIGAGVRAARQTEMTALGIVEVPEAYSLSEGATAARNARRLLQRVLAFGDEEGVEIRTMVRIGRRAAEGIIEAVAEERADLLIFGWGGPPAGSALGANAAAAAGAELGAAMDGDREMPPVFSPTIDAVVRQSPCDIAVVKQRGLDQVRSILVPVRGGPHAELALRMARDLAHRFDAKVTVMHVVPTGIGGKACQRQQLALERFIREHG